MAQYILQIFKHYLCIVWSWGFNSPMAIPNGLRFKVQGFLHKGWVEVVYNEGTDLFEVHIIADNGTVKQTEENVYLGCLVNVIDGLVERTSDYKERIEKEYGFNNQ